MEKNIEKRLENFIYKLNDSLDELEERRNTTKWKIVKLHDCYNTLLNIGVDDATLDLERMERQVIDKVIECTSIKEVFDKLDDICLDKDLGVVDGDEELYGILSKCTEMLETKDDIDIEAVETRVHEVKNTLIKLLSS